MTTELTKAAQQALDRLDALADAGNGLLALPANSATTRSIQADLATLRRALTQRPAAQTERDILNDSAWIAGAKFGWNCGVEGTRDLLNQCIEQRIKDRVEASASLPAPRQATPEPVPAEQAKWCEYVAGMVDCWVSAEWPNYHHKDEDRRVKAIAGIIERRLWALQKQQPATPEPVGEPVGTVVHVKLNGQAKPWVTVALNQDADLPDGTKLYTRPAPGVPESPRQLRKRFEQHMRDVFACKDTAFLSIDGGKTYLDGSMDNHWRTWLAAQAKGGE